MRVAGGGVRLGGRQQALHPEAVGHQVGLLIVGSVQQHLGLHPHHDRRAVGEHGLRRDALPREQQRLEVGTGLGIVLQVAFQPEQGVLLRQGLLGGATQASGAAAGQFSEAAVEVAVGEVAVPAAGQFHVGLAAGRHRVVHRHLVAGRGRHAVLAARQHQHGYLHVARRRNGRRVGLGGRVVHHGGHQGGTGRGQEGGPAAHGMAHHRRGGRHMPEEGRGGIGTFPLHFRDHEGQVKPEVAVAGRRQQPSLRGGQHQDVPFRHEGVAQVVVGVHPHRETVPERQQGKAARGHCRVVPRGNGRVVHLAGDLSPAARGIGEGDVPRTDRELGGRHQRQQNGKEDKRAHRG